MRRKVEILNPLGLHARPAAEFVRCVMGFRSEVIIHKGDERFIASSILELLSANLDCGCEVELEANGPDEVEVLDRLEQMLERFREEEQEILSGGKSEG